MITHPSHSCFAATSPRSAGGGFRCTLFTNKFGIRPIPHEEATFETFARQLQSEGHRRGEKDGGAFTLAVYRPGTTRALDNVEVVTAIGLDLEHVSPARMAEVRGALKGWEHLVYSTYSHTPELPRYRAVIPLQRELPASLHPQLWAKVAELIGTDACDPSAKDASRLFYTPAAPEGAPTEMEYWPADGGGRGGIEPLSVLGITEMQYTEALARASSASMGPAQEQPIYVDGMVEKKGILALKPRPSAEDLKARVLAADPNQWRPNLDQLFAHQPFAAPGGRNAAAFGCVSTIAWVAPEADVEDIAQLFETSVAAMWAASTSTANPPPTMAEIKDMVRRALNQRREMWYRDRSFFGAGQGEAANEPMAAEADTGPGVRTTAYEDSELESFAERQSCSVDVFIKTRLAVMHGESYHLFGGMMGDYLAPLPAEAARRSMDRDWLPFIKAGVVDLWSRKVNQNGSVSVKPKTMDQVMREYGSVARHGEIELGRRHPTFDPQTHTMIEAAAAVRPDLAPEYNPQIETWLHKLGGRQAGKLLDWIATMLQLDKPTCALNIVGPPGCGKTMLAEGLAKVFGKHAQPTPFDVFNGPWNSDILTCPIVFADEYLPGRDASAQLRAMIARSVHKIFRKFLATANAKGCIRLILAANNAGLLGHPDEDLSDDDIQAIATRVLEIDAGAGAAAYLEDIGGRATTESWVAGDGIAKHALWLAKHRTVQPGRRFLVTGDAPALAKKLLTTKPTVAAILEWLGRCVLDDGKAVRKDPYLNHVKIGGGQLLVSAAVIDGCWGEYGGTHRRPSTTAIASALRQVSHPDRVRPTTSGGKPRPRCSVIKVDTLLEWAEEADFADPADLRSAIDAPVGRRPAP